MAGRALIGRTPKIKARAISLGVPPSAHVPNAPIRPLPRYAAHMGMPSSGASIVNPSPPMIPIQPHSPIPSPAESSKMRVLLSQHANQFCPSCGVPREEAAGGGVVIAVTKQLETSVGIALVAVLAVESQRSLG